MESSMAMSQGINAGSALINSFIQGKAQRDAIEAKGEATRFSLKQQQKATLSQFSIIDQQRAEIDRELGSILSAQQLEALKARASYRAASAERGVSGASVEAGRTEISMKENMAKADAVLQSRNSKLQLARREMQANIQAKLDAQSVISGLTTGSQARQSSYMRDIGIALNAGSSAAQISMMGDTNNYG